MCDKDLEVANKSRKNIWNYFSTRMALPSNGANIQT